MSVIESAAVCKERALSSGCASVERVLSPKEKELGGFSVRRVLPTAQCRSIGPFVFFDHMGPADMPPNLPFNVRAHPHIGLATVTYLYEGALLHKDSLGIEQVIEPEAVNLMVAGRGIVHAEKTPDDLISSGQRIDGLQIWLALPAAHEKTDPAFYHYPKSDLPPFQLAQGVAGRLLIGEAHGVASPVKTFSPTLYCEYRLPANATLELPLAEERGIYVVTGGVTVGDERVSAFEMAVVNPLPTVRVTASEDSKIALIGGRSLGPRRMFWNFVASDAELIEEAKIKWQSGGFPAVPGETEVIPLPGE